MQISESIEVDSCGRLIVTNPQLQSALYDFQSENSLEDGATTQSVNSFCDNGMCPGSINMFSCTNGSCENADDWNYCQTTNMKKGPGGE